jgi:hypothetical protein
MVWMRDNTKRYITTLKDQPQRQTLKAKTFKDKKPTVSLRTLSASRVFPVDDSAKVESFLLCTLTGILDQDPVKKKT